MSNSISINRIHVLKCSLHVCVCNLGARDLFDYVRLETSCNTDFHKNEAIDERQFFALVGLVSAGVRSNRRIELEKSVADLADIQRLEEACEFAHILADFQR